MKVVNDEAASGMKRNVDGKKRNVFGMTGPRKGDIMRHEG